MDAKSHLWLEGLQATLAARLCQITPSGRDPRVVDPKARLLDDPTRPAVHAGEDGIVTRLTRRKIVEWLIGYLAMSWLILQLNDVLSEIWNVPLPFQKAVSLALGLGVVPALVVAWYHGERGRQRVCCTEVGLVCLAMGLAVAAVWRVCFG